MSKKRRADQHASRETIVLKIGGSVRHGADAALAQVVTLAEAGRPVVVVHGGGPLIGEWSKRAGLETRFVRGLRVTDEPTRDVALAVLGGLANKSLVAELLRRGVPAVGLSGVDGGMLRAEREDAELGLVGRVTLVDSSLVEELLAAARVPVVAPAAIGPQGEILNVNGDTAAGAIAASIGARLLAFVTDVPGVRAKDGRIVPALERERAKELVDDGTIEGGMIPKVEACLIAAASGCEAAIVSAGEADAIERVIAGERTGTVFPAEAVV
ncbi:MAG: acetylglutamate kinase [Chloroflexota bacterium]|nr:acetylglutamate kinase [Chloroflexota bacterium]MDE3194185.1 acetylglutamate kinase [Chloroflexota bacterium]